MKITPRHFRPRSHGRATMLVMASLIGTGIALANNADLVRELLAQPPVTPAPAPGVPVATPPATPVAQPTGGGPAAAPGSNGRGNARGRTFPVNRNVTMQAHRGPNNQFMGYRISGRSGDFRFKHGDVITRVAGKPVEDSPAGTELVLAAINSQSMEVEAVSVAP